MKWPWVTVLLWLVFISWARLGAQTADDYFNQGAQTYIYGQMERAIAVLTEGLKRFPYDSRMKDLLEKIKKQKQQQQQQQKQNQSEKNQQKQQHNPEQQKQKQKKQQAQNQQQNPQDQQNPPKPQKGQQPQKQLTREEAERILKALQGKIDQGKKPPIKIVGKKKKVEKDW